MAGPAHSIHASVLLAGGFVEEVKLGGTTVLNSWRRWRRTGCSPADQARETLAPLVEHGAFARPFLFEGCVVAAVTAGWLNIRRTKLQSCEAGGSRQSSAQGQMPASHRLRTGSGSGLRGRSAKRRA